MIYGYLRVSSDAQDVNSQKQGVESFAEQHGWVIEKYITDEGVSGGKDPDKRKLGPLLPKVHKGDIIICSEISRLGRDLYMVMDILHHCMKVEAVIYTVKDHFTLGDSIQSKVLAFAFGLSAEIERQMIRQRTREGLRLRMKTGVLLGRPRGGLTAQRKRKLFKKDTLIRQLVVNGTSIRAIARICHFYRDTVARYIMEFCSEENDEREQNGYKRVNYDMERYIQNCHRCAQKQRIPTYKDGPYKIVELPRERTLALIKQDLTVPQIAEKYPQFTYEEVYDTITCDEQFNTLYRQHAQLKLVKRRANKSLI